MNVSRIFVLVYMVFTLTCVALSVVITNKKINQYNELEQKVNFLEEVCGKE